jgi:kinesin family protein 2/24
MSVDPGNSILEFLAMMKLYRKSIELRPLLESDAMEDHQIRICIRKRSLKKKELTRKEVDVMTVLCKDEIVVHQPKLKGNLQKFLRETTLQT